MAFIAASGSPADAGTPRHKHEMVLYKVESTVKLGGAGTEIDSPNQTLRCNDGDYVLDGMWLVKHVDQYPPDPDDDPGNPSGGTYNDERDVWVQWSYATDYRTWNFQFENKAYGDAQLRLAITCINGYTQQTNGHKHQVKVTPQFGGGAATTDNPNWAGQGRFYVDSGASPAWGVCPSGTYLVAPGFKLPTTDFRLVASYPSQTEGTGRSWTWEFATENFPTTSVPANINVYGSCIDRKVLQDTGHRHWIAMQHSPGVLFADWEQSFNPQGIPNEFRYQCDQDFTSHHNYKAMVGFFWIGNGWQHHWFIGMEPRPKLRAFTFMNTDPTPGEVRYGALCINARTSNPIAP